jgi:hypothetical protein
VLQARVICVLDALEQCIQVVQSTEERSQRGQIIYERGGQGADGVKAGVHTIHLYSDLNVVFGWMRGA